MGLHGKHQFWNKKNHQNRFTPSESSEAKNKKNSQFLKSIRNFSVYHIFLTHWPPLSALCNLKKEDANRLYAFLQDIQRNEIINFIMSCKNYEIFIASTIFLNRNKYLIE